MAGEPFAVMSALKTYLAADTGAGGLNTTALANIGANVHPFSAPQGTAYPLIWHGPLSALGSEGVGPEHCGMDAVWQVGLAKQTENLFDLRAAAKRLHARLLGWNPTVTDDGVNYELFWEFLEWDPREVVSDGVKYREVLTRWAVQAQPA